MAGGLLSGCVLGSPSVTASRLALAANSGTLVRPVLPAAGERAGADAAPANSGREADEHPAVIPPIPDCLQLRCVALTFDDGPVPDTRRLIDELTTAGVTATFFDVGENAHDYPDLVRAEAALGEVEDHSWSHPLLTALSDSQIASQLSRTADELTAINDQRPQQMRPPYGATNTLVRAEADAAGMAVIEWSVDTLDWLHRDPDSVYRRAVDAVHPGSIVLMHDIHPTTVDAVPRIVDELIRRGYTLVTVSQLFGGELRPGQVYFDRELEWTRQNRPELSTGHELD